MLQSPQPPPTESILTALLNEITTIPDDFVLVLDDYHVIDASAIDQALTFLLEHLPPQMHLVITTREDPQLPLARYRARGQLTELRAADLRFTPAEAAEFLNQVMGLQPLSGGRSPPWKSAPKAGLQGCNWPRFPCRGSQDATGFIQVFRRQTIATCGLSGRRGPAAQPERVAASCSRPAILDRL